LKKSLPKLESLATASAFTQKPKHRHSQLIELKCNITTQAKPIHGDKQKGQLKSSPILFVHISVIARKGANNKECLQISIACQVARAAMITSNIIFQTI